jgi:2'-5' RNA ligase
MQELTRSFVGIRLPIEAQQKLGDVQTLIRQKAGGDVVRFTNISEIQMVLIALGELNHLSFVNVKKALPEICAQCSPFTVTIEGLGGTPSSLQPRFVWAGVGGDAEAMLRLHAALEKGLMPYLPNYQATAFKPHVDLGRLKTESEPNRTALGRAVRMAQVGAVYEMAVSKIELFRSTVTTQGPHLESEGSFALGG